VSESVETVHRVARPLRLSSRRYESTPTDLRAVQPVTHSFAEHGESTACSICLADIAVGETCHELPCGHRFHGESCILEWLKTKDSCPVCRRKLTETEGNDAGTN
jgi:hypothetical protein